MALQDPNPARIAPAPSGTRRGAAISTVGARGWAVLLVCAALGCRTQPGSDRLMSSFDAPQMTERQLRVDLYDFVVRFSGAVEAAADQMAGRAESHRVMEKALQWKSNAVPACQSAAFDNDSVAGLIDVWVLTLQMRDYFESDAAVQDLGELEELGRETSVRMVEEIQGVAVRLLGEERAEALGEDLEKFAENHPIDDPVFTRASAGPAIAMAKQDARGGLFSAATTLEARLDDVTERLTIYAGSLPKQARWQAELLTERILSRPALVGLTDMPRVLPELLADERAAVLDSLRTEREALLAAADAQRLDTLAFLRSEREAVLAAVDVQRQETLEFVRTELETLLARIDAQRDETVRTVQTELELIRGWVEAERAATLADAGGTIARTGERLLSKAFLYALVLIAIPTVLLAAVLLIGRPRLSIDLARGSRG